MENKISRRVFLKRIFGSLLSIIGIGTGGFYYAREIEPNFLDLQTLSITHSLIPKGFNGVKLIQFSDTHLGFQYEWGQLEKLVQKINNQQPDIVCFTGDLMDAPNRYQHLDRIHSILKKINAPLGKFCVYGNHDHGGYGSTLYKNVMEASGFVLLQNEHSTIELLDRSSISIAGIDDAMLGKPDIPKSLQGIRDKQYTILLSHAPDLADQAANFPVHLQLSGHSHGGQVQIPFYGALITPPFAQKYHEGEYLIKEMSLYVNRGIGTTRLPFRFLSRPELTVFIFQSQE